MEWGFSEATDHCLPAVDACYVLQLSVPPQIILEDLEDPILYLLDSYADTSMTEPCPHYLNRTLTLA
eukprot:CAMPEP_0173255858 /NCGR_PEP_ID=MMETSP1142-20121109/22790_1 /TAXON_ID=483371 /ORGANISM="non described non described, Strain CCMP2298" /LENGTH=66 /DNA_ID=CAMNT_0014189607 /DNA_START=46 /DNA_END=243 /DNA_ORIENTATION=+